jgi:hypothetical protein
LSRNGNQIIRLRILFSVRNPAYVRYYDSVLRALAARGHTVELVTQPGRRSWPPSVAALADACPQIRLSSLPDVAFNSWWELASRLRQARFYLRFLRPEYTHAPELLARARTRAPWSAVRMGEWVGRRAGARAVLVRIIDVLEQATRGAALFREYLRAQRPDLVLTTPLVVLKTAQLDLARAATELGLRNIFAVASWDHLSSKGELNFAPQQVLVWNEIQKQEAVDLHHIAADRVVVTGAPVFDDWFGRRPSTTREEFCARVGLRPDRLLVLYVCSGLLEGSPPEPPFVQRWVQHLRASGHPALRDCGILVRPHFRRGREWRGVDFPGLDNVACWPPLGDVPDDTRSKNDYFDSLYHASATVGLNTSAMIEAAILGRPVHTILVPEFQHSQQGTLHFRYLLDGPDRLLRAASSLDDHARDLAAVLDGRDADPDRSARFVRAFVRPCGVDAPATDRFVDALERMAAQPPPQPVAVPAWAPIIRPLLWPLAQAAARRARRMKTASTQDKERRLAEHRRRKRSDAVARAEPVP